MPNRSRTNLQGMTASERLEHIENLRKIRQQRELIGDVAYEEPLVAITRSADILLNLDNCPMFPILRREPCKQCEALLWNHEITRSRICCRQGQGMKY
jgi:hypothetical protein